MGSEMCIRDSDFNVWVDAFSYFAEDEISLLCSLDEILGRLESVAFIARVMQMIRRPR